MAKGQKKSGREPRKPKQPKSNTGAAPRTFLGMAEGANGKWFGGGKRPGG